MTRPVVRVLEEILLDLVQSQPLAGLLTVISARNKKELFKWKEGKEWKSLSSSEYIERVRTLACYLRDTPTADKPMIQKGDRVAFLIYNGPEWHIVRMSCAKIGAVSVPILTEASDHDLQVILQKSNPKILIVKDERQEKRAVNLLNQWGMTIPVMRYTVYTALPQTALANWHENVSPDDLAMIFFTSGTTSDPKGVMHTHRSLLSNVRACHLLFDVGEDDVVLSFLPVSHIFQQAVDTLALSMGATIVYVENRLHIRSAFHEMKPTIMASVPEMFEVLQLHVRSTIKRKNLLIRPLLQWAMKNGYKKYSPLLLDRILAKITKPLRRIVRKQVFGPRMRFFVSGGSRLEPSIGEFMEYELEVPVYQGWGMTELAGAGTCNMPKQTLIGSCGKPLPGVEIELRRDHLEEDLRRDLTEDEGEIFIKGPIVMQGYYNEPEATAETLQDGWLKTGDIGKLDENGFLFITGRKKGVIVLENGQKVHEEALASRIRSTCPLIEQIVIFGHRRPHLVALVHPNLLVLKDRLPEPYRINDNEWTSTVKDAVEAELRKAPLAQHERIKKIVLLNKQLGIEDDTMTASRKPKHRVIEEKYGTLIESMYR